MMHANDIVAGSVLVYKRMQIGLQAEAIEKLQDAIPGQVVLGPETPLISVMCVEFILQVIRITLCANLFDNLRNSGSGSKSIRKPSLFTFCPR